MQDTIGLLVSFGFVFAFIGLATVLLKGGILDPATTRKVVHIGVSHWWLLYLAFIHSPIVGLIGTISFILINTVSYKRHLFRAMEDPSPSKNLGTIYFPVSLLVLIGLSALGVMEAWEAGVGALVLGWGDGMAALVGQRFGRSPIKIFGQTKSLPGTLAMIGFSAGATLVMSSVFNPGLGAWDLLLRAGATGLFAAFVELVTPFGIDNLSIPILTALFFHYVAASPWVGPFAAAQALNVIVAWGAYKKGAVDASGAVMGAAVGTAILAAGGFPAYALLVGFFLSSTAIGRVTEKRRTSSGIEEKGGRRDALQVLANCGAGAVAALLYASTKNLAWLGAFAASFASANADTWASEIGVLYRKLPRSILTFKPVPSGASGGVSPLGFFASALGAAFIGLLFALAYGGLVRPEPGVWVLALVAAGGGFLGAVLDSLLGATLQAQYTCSQTGRFTERPVSGGVANTLVKGLAWINNDAVNLASTVMATLGVAALVPLVV